MKFHAVMFSKIVKNPLKTIRSSNVRIYEFSRLTKRSAHFIYPIQSLHSPNTVDDGCIRVSRLLHWKSNDTSIVIVDEIIDFPLLHTVPDYVKTIYLALPKVYRVLKDQPR